MPTLHAGHVSCRKCTGRGDDPDGRSCRHCEGRGWLDEFHRIKLTQGQMAALGFAPKQKPAKLGCGTDACAYDAGSDSVVKITKDRRDAVAAAAIRAMAAQPLWAVPVRAVYRLSGDVYVLVVARTEVPMPPEWWMPIEMIFRDSANKKKWGDKGLGPDEWSTWKGYEGWVRNIELANITQGGENFERRTLRRAVDVVNEMMLALRDLGLDGSDFHPGNWGMYQGRPVLIDFGMSRLVDRAGRTVPPKAGLSLPDPGDISTLPY